MEKIQIEGYTQDEGGYIKNGVKVTDFILGVKKLSLGRRECASTNLL